MALDDILITGCVKPLIPIEDTEGSYHFEITDMITDMVRDINQIIPSPEIETISCFGSVSEVLTCDFDDQTRCGWNRGDFRLWHHQTYTPETGPDVAHTGDYYLYLEASEDGVAKLESILIKPGTSICLRFSYHIFGMDSGTISVFANDKVAWKVSGSQGQEWQIAEVSIFIQKESRIEIVATADGIFSDIAIDSIVVSECQCNMNQSIESKTGLSCMFDFGTICNYNAFNNVKLINGLVVAPHGRIQSNRFHTDSEGCMTITYKSRSIGQRFEILAYLCDLLLVTYFLVQDL